jgi:hypothetical protein
MLFKLAANRENRYFSPAASERLNVRGNTILMVPNQTKLAEPTPARWPRRLTVVLGVLSFITVLTAFNITDGDLWAKLALGAHVLLHGTVFTHDIFAFTPVLPEYIDHEWGAGTIFYACLKWFGPASLMVLKVALAFGSLAAAMITGRRLGCSWNSLLVLAIPCGACILPAYAPILRSHTFTFFFFSATLLCLEEIRAGKNWPALLLPIITLLWSNVHGGFVVGLGAIGVYTAFAMFGFFGAFAGPSSEIPPSRFKVMVLALSACFLVTVINPYGLQFWTYLIPALLKKRPEITEWQPLPLFGSDVFLGFRILFALVVLILLIAWRHTGKKSWPGLVMLLVTGIFSWRSRRHGPFFGVAALAFVGPFLSVAYGRLMAHFAKTISGRMNPAFLVLTLYGLLAIYAAADFLPKSSFQVLSPIGIYPVREVDILARAQAEGNLATAFRVGSYASWRLYPRIKISVDGRYEATFPESTFRLNEDFYDKYGSNWDQLIREYPVDYIILDLHAKPLRPEDLYDRGYVLIWRTEGQSALLALQKDAAKLRHVASELPPNTIDPLDPAIPEKW